MEEIAKHMKLQVEAEEENAAAEIKKLMEDKFFELLLPAPSAYF